MKTFNNIEELHAEWEVNGACVEGVEFNKSCETIQEVLEKCPLDFRIWRLKEGYIQFAEHCPWSTLDGFDWYCLLSIQPQFADKCDWKKLTGDDWSRLLINQPQLAEHCLWDELTGVGWAYLLKYQPQLEIYKK